MICNPYLGAVLQKCCRVRTLARGSLAEVEQALLLHPRCQRQPPNEWHRARRGHSGGSWAALRIHQGCNLAHAEAPVTFAHLTWCLYKCAWWLEVLPSLPASLPRTAIRAFLCACLFCLVFLALRRSFPTSLQRKEQEPKTKPETVARTRWE